MDAVTIAGVDVAKFAGVLEWEIELTGLSREQLADTLNFHVSQLSQIKRNVDPIKIARIFKQLGRIEAEREFEVRLERERHR